MSLINEALKKAQKQQQLDAAAKSGAVLPPGMGVPTVPPPPTPPPAAPPTPGPEPEPDPIIRSRRKKAAGMSGWVKLLAGGGVVAAGVVLIGITGSGDKPAPAQIAAVESTPAESPAVKSSPAAPPVNSASPTPVEAEPGQIEIQSPSIPPATPTVRINLPPVVRPPVEVVAQQPEEMPAQSVPSNPEPTPYRPVSPPADTQPKTIPLPRSESVRPPPRVDPPLPRVDTPVLPTRSNPLEVSIPRTPPSGEPRPVPATPAGKVVFDNSGGQSVSNLEPAGTVAAPADEAVLNYLERVRVTGIRVSNTDPKVLMNNRVYRLNDIVDRDLKLRIVHIATRELRFEDPAGHIYRKTF